MTDPVLTYYGTKEGTDLRFPKRMRAEIAASLPDGELEITVRRKRKRRSNEQNRYYWGCIVRDISETLRQDDPETGWTPDGVHEVLKFKFLPLVRDWREYVNTDTGEAIREPMTTAKLTTVEWETYSEHCRKFAAEFFGIVIPLPNEQGTLSLEHINI